MTNTGRDPRRGFGADSHVSFRRPVLALSTTAVCSGGMAAHVPPSLVAFGSTGNALGIKSIDDSKRSTCQNSDRAGAPGNFAIFAAWGVKARGGSNFTGQSGYRTSERRRMKGSNQDLSPAEFL